MLVREVSRALEEMAAIIARLQFVAAELQQAKQLELKSQRKLKPPWRHVAKLSKPSFVPLANTKI